MSNGLEIILQKWSFHQWLRKHWSQVGDSSKGLWFSRIYSFILNMEMCQTVALCGVDHTNSRAPSILVVYANSAPWCCEHGSPMRVPHSPPGSTLNPFHLMDWVSFSIFIPFLLLHSSGQCIHPSINSFNEYLWAPTVGGAPSQMLGI